MASSTATFWRFTSEICYSSDVHCAWHSSRDRAFDDHAFYLDFVDALRRLAAQRPFLDERARWWLALAEADREDVARWVAAQNAQADVDYFARQRVSIVPTLDELSATDLVGGQRPNQYSGAITRAQRANRTRQRPAAPL